MSNMEFVAKNDTTHIYIRIPSEVKARLEQVAKNEKTTISGSARTLLLYGLDNYKHKDKGENMEFKLTPEQFESVLTLINTEILTNTKNGDTAYNTHWENIKRAMGIPAPKLSN